MLEVEYKQSSSKNELNHAIRICRTMTHALPDTRTMIDYVSFFSLGSGYKLQALNNKQPVVESELIKKEVKLQHLTGENAWH